MGIRRIQMLIIFNKIETDIQILKINIQNMLS